MALLLVHTRGANRAGSSILPRPGEQTTRRGEQRAWACVLFGAAEGTSKSSNCGMVAVNPR